MIHVIKYLALGLFFVVCAKTTIVAQAQNGFENYIHTPQFGNFDNINEKGDVAVQVASGGLINSLFPSVRLSVSPVDKIGAGLSYFTFTSSNSNSEVQTTKAYVASGDLFYYGDLSKTSKVTTSYRLGAGYGFGTVQRVYNEFNNGGEANLGIQRFIAESGLMARLQKVGFGLGLRAKYFNFSNKFGFGDVSRQESDRLDYLVATAPVFLFDINTRFEFGGEIGRLFFSWDQTINKIKDEDEMVPGYLNKSSIHLGFYILLNKAINKKSKEK